MPEKWRHLRPAFTDQIDAAASSMNIAVSWLSHNWVAQLDRGPISMAIVGYAFPLNNAAAAQLATDKVAAFEVLHSQHVPAIEHWLVRFSWSQPTPTEVPERGWTVSADLRPPLVLKPHADGGGVDVVRAYTAEEIRAQLAMLSVRYRAVAASPFVDIDAEYRIVVMDGAALLAFRKLRQCGPSGAAEWRHNLRYGAVPEVIELPNVDEALLSRARAAMAALGLRFASVDVVAVDGAWQVLEVNSSVCLEHFSSHSPECYDLASAVYRSAIERMFS